jgi:hypothetical protein
MKKILSTVGVLALVAGAYMTLNTVNNYSPVATAEASGKSVYNATLYVAGMGGHFSVADVTIDPNNAAAPITVHSTEMLDIGGNTHPTHDARIDENDRNIMFWSTYKLDNWKTKSQQPSKCLQMFHSRLRKELFGPAPTSALPASLKLLISRLACPTRDILMYTTRLH